MDDYPLLGMFFTVLWFFLSIAWISCLVSILRDIFRSSDLSGAGKAGWTRKQARQDYIRSVVKEPAA
jgi:hypothetical protein